MKLWVGTSGYSYKEWKGTFYPEKLAAKDMLRFYGEQLPAVEINNTFYRLPSASVLQSWAEQVPDGFRFALKASQRITHIKRLRDAEDETSYLLQTASTLGDKLGVVLFQLPPNLRKDVERLSSFLRAIGDDTAVAFEFRHASWLDDEVFDTLRSRNCALCISDTDGEPDAPLVATATWGYQRLRRQDYTDSDLGEWAKRVHAQGWKEAYVFFKHEDGGIGPKLASRFLEIAATTP